MTANEKHDHETQDFTNFVSLQAELARKDAYIRELEGHLAFYKDAAVSLTALDSYRAAEIQYLSTENQ